MTSAGVFVSAATLDRLMRRYVRHFRRALVCPEPARRGSRPVGVVGRRDGESMYLPLGRLGIVPEIGIMGL
jgi:hypothetical protein